MQSKQGRMLRGKFLRGPQACLGEKKKKWCLVEVEKVSVTVGGFLKRTPSLGWQPGKVGTLRQPVSLQTRGREILH